LPETIEMRVDGRAVAVAAGTSVAAALVNSGAGAFRRSVCGEARWPICGMGICFECCVTIDGVPHRRSCLEICRPGMEVTTDG
jgi:predicted molibdopterin-dependent oxidoreductase YjgC